jgi:hypothetical protein
VRVTVARSRPLSIVLQWLSSPRHAGSLATGLVAALGLGLWLDLGVQPVIERPAVPASPAPSEQRQADATATAPMPPPAAVAKEKAEPEAAATALPTPPAATTKRAARPAQDATPDKAEAQQTRRNEEPPPSAAIDEAAAALKPAQPTPSAAAGPPAAAAAAGRVASMPSGEVMDRLLRHDRASDLRAAQAPRTASPTLASPDAGAALAEPVAAASPALTLLRRARGELASGAARWDWQAPGASGMAPFDDAAQAWLLGVVQSARGRWIDVAERAAASDAIEVRWWRDGWPHATLRIESEGLRWIEPNGRIRYAALQAATLQRLRGH